MITGPGTGSVTEVPAPQPRPDGVVVEISKVGVCGTDIELFDGSMAYLHDGNARYPLIIGHEWAGRVVDAGAEVDPSWVGRRVTGDTMLGCGQCVRCTSGRAHVCRTRYEVGVRGGWPGALAERLALPAGALYAVPDSIDDVRAAMIEPAGNAWRAFDAGGVVAGERLLILGPGTIGLLCAMFARAAGVEVHMAGREGRSLRFARTLGFDGVWTTDTLPELPWHGVVDASSAAHFPRLAVDLIEPGRRVALVGLAGLPSTIDTRDVALKDVTLAGILGGSAGLRPAIDAFANGTVDPGPLVSSIVPMEAATDILAGRPIPGVGSGPKTVIDVAPGSRR
ncbi:zinc-dependent alcohol dehydrogenase [Nocardia aurantia]|uniref:zinc-dependent alcohol dehydrogenase n=1 Tax=Nocardia aurantia TaxID=2585199 RepID=UPI0029E8060E|nr:alcohol dehydrogenase catalytic domain-containing protein [Nocardia aurantia]